jgi:DNA-binding FrmR family transcriptional regulator
MSTLNELVSQTAAQAAAHEGRIAALESSRKGKDIWDIISALSPAVTGIVLLLIGYGLKDSVDQAMKREELHLSSVKDMQEALVVLEKPDITKETSVGTSLTLAAFGHYAVPSLLMVLDNGDEVRSPAAEEALRAIALNEPQAVCDSMLRVLSNRSRRFIWLTHLAALRLLGDASCDGGTTVLKEYSRALDGVKDDLAAFASTVSDRVPPDTTSVAALKTQLAKTQALLVQTSKHP